MSEPREELAQWIDTTVITEATQRNGKTSCWSIIAFSHLDSDASHLVISGNLA